MPDILHDLPIHAPVQLVFEAVSTAKGLDAWWSSKSQGEPEVGSEYQLQFGPEAEWRCVVTKCAPPSEFEIEMTVSDNDWNGTRVGFTLVETGNAAILRFRHLGWSQPNDHFRQSCFCWAMYLRCLKRYCERKQVLPYANRFAGDS